MQNYCLCFLRDEDAAKRWSSHPSARLIHLIRHGESIHNVVSADAAKKGIFCLCDCDKLAEDEPRPCPFFDATLLDSDLTEKGRLQAQSVWNVAQACNPDIVLVSSLSRALETACILFESKHIIALDELRAQVSRHMQSRRRPVSMSRTRFPSVDFSGISHDADAMVLSDGKRESRSSLDYRADRFLKILLERDERSIAVVTHFTFLLTLFFSASDARLIGVNPDRPGGDPALFDCSESVDPSALNGFLPVGNVRTLLVVPRGVVGRPKGIPRLSIVVDENERASNTCATPRFRGPRACSAYQDMMIRANVQLIGLFYITGPMKEEVLRYALNALCDHHPALNVRLGNTDSGGFLPSHVGGIPLTVQELDAGAESVREYAFQLGKLDRHSSLVECTLIQCKNCDESCVALAIDHCVADARSVMVLASHLITTLNAARLSSEHARVVLDRLSERRVRMIEWERRIPQSYVDRKTMDLPKNPSDILGPDTSLSALKPEEMGSSPRSFLRKLSSHQTRTLVEAARARECSLWGVLQAAVHFSECLMIMKRRSGYDPPFLMSARVVRDLRSVLEPRLPLDYVDCIVSHFNTPQVAVDVSSCFWGLARSLTEAVVVHSADALSFTTQKYENAAYSKSFHYASTSVNNFGEFMRLGLPTENGPFGLRDMDLHGARHGCKDRVKVYTWTVRGILSILFVSSPVVFREETIDEFSSLMVSALDLCVESSDFSLGRFKEMAKLEVGRDISSCYSRELRIFRRLNDLYGEEFVRRKGHKLLETIERGMRRINNRSDFFLGTHEEHFGEKDVIVIAYPDHVTEVGRLPLVSLLDFCCVHFKEVVPIVHILPFHPSSGDGGFSISNYADVDDKFGDWGNIDAFADCGIDPMMDVVLNHCSVSHEWFQQFLRNECPGKGYFVVPPNDNVSWLGDVVRARAHPLLTEFSTSAGTKKVWTTYSPNQVDLNWSNIDVLIEFIEIFMLHVEHGARILRLDAFSYLWKSVGTCCHSLPQCHELLRLLRDIFDYCGAAWVKFLASITNVPGRVNLEYFGGPNESQRESDLIYNLPVSGLLLLSLYAESTLHLMSWLSTLPIPPPGRSYVNLASTHDGIGLNWLRDLIPEAELNEFLVQAEDRGCLVARRKRSDKSDAEPWELNTTFFSACAPSSREAMNSQRHIEMFMATQATLLALRGVPGIYLPILFAGKSDPERARSMKCNREINRTRYHRDSVETILANPSSESRIVMDAMKHLLAVRSACPVFSPCAAQRVVTLNPQLFSVLRGDASGEWVICITSFSSDCISLEKCRILERFGLADRESLFDVVPHSACSDRKIVWAPFQTRWFWSGWCRDQSKGK